MDPAGDLAVLRAAADSASDDPNALAIALEFAALRGWAEGAAVLLEMGAEPNSDSSLLEALASGSGNVAVLTAAESYLGFCDEQLQVISVLADESGNTDLADQLRTMQSTCS